MVEDILLDRKGGNPNKTHTLGLDYLTKIKQTNNLTDIWQKENPHKTLFTFHNKNQQIHSRIDRFYIKNNQRIKNVSIVPNGLSDHDAMQIKIEIKNPNVSGTGYWKLNTSILKQTSFQKLFKNFGKDWHKEKNKYSSLNQWWESSKLYFKIIAIKFLTEKNQKINNKLQKLTNNILEEKNKKEPNKMNIDNWQNQINDIENYKTQGTIIRSKKMTIINVINEETPNKYSYLQEQQKQAKKTN